MSILSGLKFPINWFILAIFIASPGQLGISGIGKLDPMVHSGKNCSMSSSM